MADVLSLILGGGRGTRLYETAGFDGGVVVDKMR
jgi:hypothetical protein